MQRILILPDIRLNQKPDTGYPVRRAGYRISGKGRIPDIRPDIWFDNYIFGKISNKFVKTIIDFCKPQTKQDLVTKLICMQIFFLALFEEKLYKLLDHLNMSRISGRAIWYPAGYRIAKMAGLSGRISGASLTRGKLKIIFSR
jgi:hypothetical protein